MWVQIAERQGGSENFSLFQDAGLGERSLWIESTKNSSPLQGDKIFLKVLPGHLECAQVCAVRTAVCIGSLFIVA